MPSPRYDALTIGLTFRERADLWARIDRRVDQMARDGLEAEVRGLLSSGLPRTCTAMQAIGYKEFVAAVDGQISWKEAEELVKLRSRQYAKRQLTLVPPPGRGPSGSPGRKNQILALPGGVRRNLSGRLG